MPPTFANGRLCYIEIPATGVQRSTDSYQKVLGWQIRRPWVASWLVMPSQCPAGAPDSHRLSAQNDAISRSSVVRWWPFSDTESTIRQERDRPALLTVCYRAE